MLLPWLNYLRCFCLQARMMPATAVSSVATARINSVYSVIVCSVDAESHKIDSRFPIHQTARDVCPIGEIGVFGHFESWIRDAPDEVYGELRSIGVWKICMIEVWIW